MSQSENDMKQLIERASRGEDDAISTLYEMHVDRIYRYVSYRVPDYEVEDIVAEVFLRMLESLPDFEYTGAPFESWLYRIASARVADYHRQKKRHPEEDLPDNLTMNGKKPEEHILEQYEFETVREALQQLSEDEQTILLLRFVELKSHKEVADIMDKSTAATRTLQHRALTKLGELLDATEKRRHYLQGESQPVQNTRDDTKEPQENS